MLDAHGAAIIAEEEALLARARAALAEAHRSTARPDRVRLAELREEAQRASEDDLPTVLHELAVQHRLAERPAVELPDLDAPYLAHFRVEEAGVFRD